MSFLVPGGIFWPFLLGLFVGSFLNVVIFRLHSRTRKWWVGRSRCPSCNKVLKVRELVPVVSYLASRGRCRSCGQKIDIQYPLVEFTTAVLFSMFFVKYFGLNDLMRFSSGQFLEFGFLFRDWFVISIAIIVFVYDLRYMLILDKVMVPSIVLAFFVNLALGVSFLDMALGGLIGFLFFTLQFVLSRGKWVGGGDGRLGLFIGVVVGWKMTLLVLFLAYVFGAVIALGLIVVGSKKWGERIPFGTFLTASLVFALLYGENILHWYLGYFL